MKAESEGSVEEPGKEAGSAQHETRICPVCGTKLFADANREFCPVCILRGARGAESGSTGESDSVSELGAASADEARGGPQLLQFENYLN